MSDPIRPFDRALRTMRRERALRGNFADVAFLHAEVASRVLERLGDIRRRFGTVVEIGATGGLGPALLAAGTAERVVTLDPVRAALDAAPGLRVQADEELLPFAQGSVDAVVSAIALHAVNDLPGLLAQSARALRPDGLFLAAFPGGETLRELRWALTQAELEVTGGAALRVAPMVDVRDAGSLLQRAGFALPVVDLDRITVTYAEPLRLVDELRRAGEAAALSARPVRPLRRDVLARAIVLYRERFADPSGRVPATFDIVFMTGWAPHASQPKPARRGSGKVDLAQALGAELTRVPGTDPDRG